MQDDRMEGRTDEAGHQVSLMENFRAATHAFPFRMDYTPAQSRQKRFNMPLPRHQAELIGQPAAREPDTLSGYWFRPSDAAQGSRLQGVHEAARTEPG